MMAGFIWFFLLATLFFLDNSGLLFDLSGMTPEEADALQSETWQWTVLAKSFQNLQAIILNPFVAAITLFLTFLVGSVSTMISNALVAVIDWSIGLATKTPNDHLKFVNWVRLIGREPELYDLHERLRYEVEFRAGVSLPLITTIFALSSELSSTEWGVYLIGLWWLFLLMIALLVQAIRNRRRLRVVLLEAMSRLEQRDHEVTTEETSGGTPDQGQEQLLEP